MNHRELVRDMVVETRQRLASDGWGVDLEKDIDSPKGRSVSVKIRIHNDLRYGFLSSFVHTRVYSLFKANYGFHRHGDRTSSKPSD